MDGTIALSVVTQLIFVLERNGLPVLNRMIGQVEYPDGVAPLETPDQAELRMASLNYLKSIQAITSR